VDSKKTLVEVGVRRIKMKYTIYTKVTGKGGTSLCWRVGDETGKKPARLGSCDGGGASLYHCTLEEAAKIMVSDLERKLSSEDSFTIKIGYAPWDGPSEYKIKIDEFFESEESCEGDSEKMEEMVRLTKIEDTYFSKRAERKEKVVYDMITKLSDKKIKRGETK